MSGMMHISTRMQKKTKNNNKKKHNGHSSPFFNTADHVSLTSPLTSCNSRSSTGVRVASTAVCAALPSVASGTQQSLSSGSTTSPVIVLPTNELIGTVV